MVTLEILREFPPNSLENSNHDLAEIILSQCSLFLFFFLLLPMFSTKCPQTRDPRNYLLPRKKNTVALLLSLVLGLVCRTDENLQDFAP